MSLVGPSASASLRARRHYAPWHRRRVLEAKPGITGLWQVTGRSRTTFDEMVRLDLRYARTRSVWTDLRILLRHPGGCCGRKRGLLTCRSASISAAMSGVATLERRWTSARRIGLGADVRGSRFPRARCACRSRGPGSRSRPSSPLAELRGVRITTRTSSCVPFVSAYLLYLNRDAILQAMPSPVSVTGIFLAAVGAATDLVRPRRRGDHGRPGIPALV